MELINKIKSWFNKDKKVKRYKRRDTRRSFTVTQRKHIWYNQGSKCKKCNKRLDQRTVIFDHMKRWSDGGRTDIANGQALCPTCNNMKNFTERLRSAETRKIKGSAKK